MEEYKHVTAWVKEQFAEGYLLTWLLTRSQLWWCEGELYQTAVLKDGDRLKAFVENQEQDEFLLEIAETLTRNQSWDAVAAALRTVFLTYQQELTKLPDSRRADRISRRSENQTATLESWSREASLSNQQPSADTLTGLND